MRNVFITGATGLLGQAVIEELLRKGDYQVTAFVMPKDPLVKELPVSVNVKEGNILAPDSLREAIQEGDAVVHLAALVSICKKDNDKMKLVNLQGTKNVVDVALEKRCSKFIYISSSHVLGYHKGERITESCFGRKTENIGAYETTKKEATSYVFEKAKEGLNACVIYPSGIISDHDRAMGEISTLLYSLASGKLRFYVKGGYAFVDAHDVARSIVAALENGKPGEGYLVSGGYLTLQQIDEIVRRKYPHLKKGRIVPFFFTYLGLPFIMLHEKIGKKKPLYTYMSLKTVQTEADFDTSKTQWELGIVFTPLEESIDRALDYIESTTHFQ